EGHRALHLRSEGDSSMITKELDGTVNLKSTPVLEWRWMAVTLPKGADARSRQTDDQAAQLYVVWPRFPQEFRSRIIGYIWDTRAPAGLVVKSEKTDRKSTRLNSSHVAISYAVFCLKKKKKNKMLTITIVITYLKSMPYSNRRS